MISPDARNYGNSIRLRLEHCKRHCPADCSRTTPRATAGSRIRFYTAKAISFLACSHTKRSRCFDYRLSNPCDSPQRDSRVTIHCRGWGDCPKFVAPQSPGNPRRWRCVTGWRTNGGPAMRRREALRSSRRVIAVAGTILGAACQAPAPAPPPQPVRVTPQLVPAPASMVLAAGPPFEIARTTGIYVDGNSPEVASIGEVLAAQIRRPTGFPVAVSPIGTPSAGSIILRLAPDRAALGEERYEVTVGRDSVRLVANRPAGLFRGIQTIRQLLPADIESEMEQERYDWSIPALSITDQPRFAYRGAMLDVSRHFFTVKEVEQYLDVLALYKLNVLHLHLSDDQGWRIQIDSRPKLTSMGSLTQVGGGPGRFFTKQDYQG